MNAADSERRTRAERRWPPATAVVSLLLLLALLPARVRVFPHWVGILCAAVVIVPMIAVQLTRGRPLWVNLERWTTIGFVLFTGSATLENLAMLIRGVVEKASELQGLQLFTSSIAAWTTNVLVFSLLFWQLDRGGPEARASSLGVRPDWQFPQSGAPGEAPPGWWPTYVDYLFLAYVTATAFSPTDALPLTARAKLLIMLESAISLATIVVVAARAINILGS